MSEVITQIWLDILTGMIITGILAASSFLYIFYKCLKKQSEDTKLMKKATACVLRRLVHETITLHPDNKDEIEDLERTYREFTDSE